MKLIASLAFALVCSAMLHAQIKTEPIHDSAVEPTPRHNQFVVIAPPQIQSPTAGIFIDKTDDATRFVTNEDGGRHQFTLADSQHDARLVQRDAQTANPSNHEKINSDSDQNDAAQRTSNSFHWRQAFEQSLLMLAVQHGYAFTQQKTRRDLKGEFFHDYARSVKSIHGWDDGGRFFTNYIAHPMQGSLTGFIQIQNDPKGMRQRFGASSDYLRSRMKALAWSAAWSTQFEIGPISQASIGNVGLHNKQTWGDIVTTPTAGLGMLVTEDALDRYLIERIERGTDSFYLTIGSRMLLNPTRTIANLFRFKKPWFRDRPRAN